MVTDCNRLTCKADLHESVTHLETSNKVSTVKNDQEYIKNLLLDELSLAMEYMRNSLKSIETELAIESLTFMKSVLEKV